jgi:hypothetical protein
MKCTLECELFLYTRDTYAGEPPISEVPLSEYLISERSTPREKLRLN